MTILDAAKRRFGENVKGIKDATPYPHRECQGWCYYEISFVNKNPMLIKGNVFIDGGLYVFYTKGDAKDFACAYIEHMLKKPTEKVPGLLKTYDTVYVLATILLTSFWYLEKKKSSFVPLCHLNLVQGNFLLSHLLIIMALQM